MHATKKMEMVDQRERFLSRTYRAQPVLAQISRNFVGFFLGVQKGSSYSKGSFIH